MKQILFLILIILSVNFLEAQKVTGTVTDDLGNALPGVNVSEKGNFQWCCNRH